MTRSSITTRCCAVLGSFVVGAICGGLLSAFGQVISGSALAIAATIVVGFLLGAWLGQFWGAMNGAMLGGLATAFGRVVGGSLIGVLCTIGVCGLLGGWLRWRSPERGNDCVSPQQLPGVQQRVHQSRWSRCTLESDVESGPTSATSVRKLVWS